MKKYVKSHEFVAGKKYVRETRGGEEYPCLCLKIERDGTPIITRIDDSNQRT